MDTVIKLLTTTKERDNRGVWRESHTPREVFAQVHSVTRNEFFEGGKKTDGGVEVIEVED